MTAARIDVKSTGGPYNLGTTKEWTPRELDFLISEGAYVNEVDYIHIPLDKIKGKVSLGIGQKGEPPDLKIGGKKLSLTKGQRPNRIIW